MKLQFLAPSAGEAETEKTCSYPRSVTPSDAQDVGLELGMNPVRLTESYFCLVVFVTCAKSPFLALRALRIKKGFLSLIIEVGHLSLILYQVTPLNFIKS